MDRQLANNWTNNFTFRFNRKEGIRAHFNLFVAIGVELWASACWFYLSSGLGAIDRYFLLQHEITPRAAFYWGILIVLLVSVLIHGTLFFCRKGEKRIIEYITDYIDKLVMDLLFHQKVFFPSERNLTFIMLDSSFHTYIPSLPDMPPRHRLT